MSRYILTLITLATALGAAAITVSPEAPGTLKPLVEDAASQTGLNVNGPVDASDLYFIAREMPGLRTLDLSKASIKAYKGDKIGGRTSFPEGMIPQNVFTATRIESLALPEEGTVTVGDGAFAGTPLRTLSVGANVDEIGDGAFASCPYLTEITIASPVIGAGAFADCPALTSVKFTAPARLGTGAFARDAALTSVAGDATLTEIGDGAFAGCSSLSDFTFGSAVTRVGDRAFSRTGLTSADLSDCSMKPAVGAWAFAENPKLATADFSGAASTGDGIVFDCPALTRFVPSAADSISAYSYAKDTSLDADGLIADGVRVVGANALRDMSQVESIIIPASVEYIGANAMEGMSGLKEMTTLATEVPELGDDVWRGVPQADVTLHVPANHGSYYEGADQWKNFIIEDPAVTGITDAADDSATASLKGRFVGDELQVSISGVEISRLALHDTSGIMLLAVEPMEDFVAIDTSGMSARVFIVSATLTDGRTATLKLAKPTR